MSKELNIKSSTIEKGLELAKDFLGKLISPSIEEIGLLISDNIKFFRFKNQVKILLKTKEYVERKNISMKEIPVKILVPLLEKASLEEDEKLQNKWSNMLINMIDSQSNFQNQIFPHILSQLSFEEYEALKDIFKKEKFFLVKLDKLVEMRLQDVDKYFLDSKTREAQAEIDKIDQEGFLLSLEEFEIANIQRLGLIKQLPPKIIIDSVTFNIGKSLGIEDHHINAEYDPYNYGFRITELGKKFISICELIDE